MKNNKPTLSIILAMQDDDERMMDHAYMDKGEKMSKYARGTRKGMMMGPDSMSDGAMRKKYGKERMGKMMAEGRRRKST